MQLKELTEILNLNKTPQTFEKYISSISLRKNPITKKTLDEAFRFYQLEEEVEFYNHCLGIIEELKINKVLKKAVLLLKYISFEAPNDDFLEMEYWKANPPRTDISALVLLSAVNQHKKAMKGLDTKQRAHQIIGIRDTILRGLKLYKINGISYGSLAWGIRFVRQLLMKFGRLQYEFSYYHDPYIVLQNKKGEKTVVSLNEKEKIKKQNILIQPGDFCINIHIDRNGRLEPKSVNMSLKESQKKLKKYFPLLKNKNLIYRCHSWLLSQQMGNFLTPDRHIMYFQNLFFILPPYSEDTGDDFFRFLFNTQKSKSDFSIENLAEDTSLRKKVKEYLLNGNQVQEGRGLIFEDVINKID